MAETRSSSWRWLVGIAAAVVSIGAGIYLLSTESASDTPTVFDALMHGIGAYFIARGVWMIASHNPERSVVTDAPSMTLEQLEARRKTVSPRFYEKTRSEILAARRYRECPHCKEEMRRDASVCPHCQRESDAWMQNEGYWWRTAEDGTWLYLDETSSEWRKVQPAS
jgi:hypothetical protein